MKFCPFTDHPFIKRTIFKTVWDSETVSPSHLMSWKTFVKVLKNTSTKFGFKKRICSLWTTTALSICIHQLRVLLSSGKFMWVLWDLQRQRKNKRTKPNCSKFWTVDIKCPWLVLEHGKYRQITLSKWFTMRLNVDIVILTVRQFTKMRSRSGRASREPSKRRYAKEKIFS